MGLLFFNYVMP